MTDLLGLVAELAVGLTGFAAVASALGRAPSGSDVRLDRVRLRNLVEIGIVTTFLAVFPRALWPEGPAPQWVWHTSGAAFLISAVGVAYGQTRRAKVLALAQMTGYSRISALMIYILGYGSVLLVAAGLMLPPIPVQRAYAGGLFLLLTIVGLNFVRVAASLLTHRVDRRD